MGEIEPKQYCNCPYCEYCRSEKAMKAIEQPLHGEEVNSDRLSVIIKGLRASVKNLSDNGISDLSIRAVEHWQNELDKFIQQTQPSKEVTDSELEAEAEELYPYRLPATEPFSSHNAIQEGLRQAHIKAAKLHRNDGLNLLIEWIQNIDDSPQRTFIHLEILTKAKEIQSIINK